MNWEDSFVDLIQSCSTQEEKINVLLALLDFLGYEKVVLTYKEGSAGVAGSMS